MLIIIVIPVWVRVESFVLHVVRLNLLDRLLFAAPSYLYGLTFYFYFPTLDSFLSKC